MIWRIVFGTQEHCNRLAPCLREADKLEILRAGVTVPEALERSWSESLMTRALIVDNEVAAVWGCAGSPLSGLGQPWLLTAPAFARVPVAMVKAGREDTLSWLRVFPRLENYVDATYREACRFLEVLGYRLDPPEPAPRTGAPFRRFWKER